MLHIVFYKPNSLTSITLVAATLKNTHTHKHTVIYTWAWDTLFYQLLIWRKKITQLIESSLVDECFKHTQTQTHTPAWRKRAYRDVLAIY